MPESIGHSDTFAKGGTYEDWRHTRAVPKHSARTFWARCKEALEEARLPATQVYVAKRLGVSQPSVSEWNLEGGFPTMKNTIALAEICKVNVEWLLTERGHKRPLPQDATAQRLWDLWPQLDEGDKRELIGQAQGMLRRRPSAADAPIRAAQQGNL